MLAICFFTVVYVVLSVVLSKDEGARVLPSQLVDLSSHEPGTARVILWDGRPVLIYRRVLAEQQALRVMSGVQKGLLADPDSVRSTQPDWADNSYRSRVPEWFVSIGVGMDFSCPVRLLKASDELFQGTSWPGGFVDECRGSRYDLAGRVFKNQFATKNLAIPEYTLKGSALLLGAIEN